MKRVWIVVLGIIALHFWLYAPENSDTPKASPVAKPTTGVTERVRVTTVIDGDTFDIEDGRRVRIIGIDTPEREEYFYEESSQALRSLIGGVDIEMIRDVSETDTYGRLLRYVFVDDVFVNEYMVREGYARTLTIPPDVQYADVLKNVQRDARERRKGMWGK